MSKALSSRMAKQIGRLKPSKIIDTAGVFEKHARVNDLDSIGKMLFFEYSAKHWETLPYWDRYPLIFYLGPSRKVPNAILGLNLHYLSPIVRARFMDAIYTQINNNPQRRRDYDFFKDGGNELKSYKACIKMYLLDGEHLKTPFIDIKPEYWDFVLFLPMARFQKKPDTYVWEQSDIIINRQARR